MGATDLSPFPAEIAGQMKVVSCRFCRQKQGNSDSRSNPNSRRRIHLICPRHLITNHLQRTIRECDRRTIQPRTGLLLSGGIDSAVLLDQLLGRGWQVVPFYVRTGCAWQDCELAAIERFLARFAHFGLADMVVLDMPLADLYGNHWSITGADVPDNSTPDEAVYLPGRNPLLLIKPALWCRMHGIEHLALATLSANPFRDATPTFFARFEEMLHEAMDGQMQIAAAARANGEKSRAGTGPRLAARTYVLMPVARRRHALRPLQQMRERRRGFREAGLEIDEYANAIYARSSSRSHSRAVAYLEHCSAQKSSPGSSCEPAPDCAPWECASECCSLRLHCSTSIVLIACALCSSSAARYVWLSAPPRATFANLCRFCGTCQSVNLGDFTATLTHQL